VALYSLAHFGVPAILGTGRYLHHSDQDFEKHHQSAGSFYGDQDRYILASIRDICRTDPLGPERDLKTAVSGNRREKHAPHADKLRG
jgi:hypothetical protein